jgi:ketosteroid isomerase-like protein
MSEESGIRLLRFQRGPKREVGNMGTFALLKHQQAVKCMLVACGTAALLLSTSCAPRSDTDALAKALTQRDDDWSKAAATKNAETVASFYAEDAIAYPPNQPMTMGQSAAKAVWASYFADSTFSISWKTEHAGVSKGGDLGFTTGTYEDSFQGPLGTLVNEKGKYVCVWAKQADGTWKAIHDIWNSDSR